MTYTLDGDDSQAEHTFGIVHRGDGEDVDGLVWSRSLMDRLNYPDAQQPGRCVPVPRKRPGPDDRWERIGDPASETKPATDGGKRSSSDVAASDVETAATSDVQASAGDCYWLHKQSCDWIAICDDNWP